MGGVAAVGACVVAAVRGGRVAWSGAAFVAARIMSAPDVGGGGGPDPGTASGTSRVGSAADPVRTATRGGCGTGAVAVGDLPVPGPFGTDPAAGQAST